MVGDKDLPSLLRAHDDRLRQTPMSLAARVRIHQELRVARGEGRREWSRLAVAVLGSAALGAGATFVWVELHRAPPAASSNPAASMAMF